MKISILGMRRSFYPVLLVPVIRGNMFKLALAALVLLFTFTANAQTIPVKTPADLSVGDDPTKGTSTSTGTTLFCVDQSGFTLTSSTSDPTSPSVNYTSWQWLEIDASGNAGALPATATPTNEKLVVASATPGWHTYQVTASTGTANCPADPVIFTVFVLPGLTVTSAVDQANNPSLTYCAANGAPTNPTKAINLTSTVAFNGNLNSVPGLKQFQISDFDLKYVWNRTEIGGSAQTQQVATTANYTVTDPAVTSAGTEKKYKYSVTVAYTVKSCNTTYSAIAQSSGADAVITVTPKPGKPVITIQ
ncbi:hypothetical protein FHW36_10128 [Chitinophaga polysaccharea]|uniref:Ig-like domain-containing protein n=1 Tax=Chitinophaga polysaccharea TaxID=1293035 RepID=A0A561Q186_9BACT|nr:hypothetical protein [Chitinophaga polysaccharea]TWF44113.1 hypothetical protein FHW36_10128 [Chitinophaga polysaccharea]